MIIKKSYKTDTTYLLGNTYGMKAISLNFLGKYEEALEYSFKSDECKVLQTEKDSLKWLGIIMTDFKFT